MKRHYLVAALLVAVTLAVFHPVGRHEFVAWDDDPLIYKNPYLNGSTAPDILRFWQGSYEKIYMPLTYTAWALLARTACLSTSPSGAGRESLSGEDFPPLSPQVFHLANLLLHTLNVLLVLAILRQWADNDWAAAGGALLFSLHPVQVESVAWVSELKGVLCAFFSLLALWRYGIYLQSIQKPGSKRHNGNYAVATVCFVLALLAKPSAVAVPPIAFLLGHWIAPGQTRRSLLNLSLWLGLAACWILLTRHVQPVQADVAAVPVWARFFVAGDALAFYLLKLLLPLRLCTDYGRSPEFVLGHTWGYLTWILPCGVATLIWLWRRRRPIWVIVGGVFLCGVLPVLGFVPFAYQWTSTVADRYLYLAMLGPAFGLTWLLTRSRSVPAKALCVVWLLLLAVQSTAQTARWRSTITLFEHTLTVNPRSWVAYSKLGVALEARGNLTAAVAHYRQALHLDPEDANLHANLGSALVKQGRLSEAVQEFREALRLDPEDANLHTDLGSTLAKQGKIVEAVEQYREALRLDPESAVTHYNLANILNRQGKTAEAVSLYREALRLKPGLVKALNNLAITLDRQGKTAEAVSLYREALRRDPTFAEAHNNLALVLEKQGKLDEAVAHYREVLRVDPNRAEVHNDLGLLLARQNSIEEAAAHFREAVRLRPGFARPHINLGNALAQRGETTAAIEHYRAALRLEPNDPAAHNNIGLLLAAEGRADEAMMHYRAALRLAPKDAEAHYNLGLALARQNRTEKAATNFRAALRLRPDYVEAHYNLGVILMLAGKTEDALDRWKAALRLEPGYEPARKAIADALRKKTSGR